jgi:hypothetical protein
LKSHCDGGNLGDDRGCGRSRHLAPRCFVCHHLDNKDMNKKELQWHNATAPFGEQYDEEIMHRS